MAIKRPAEPPSPSSTAREARLQLGRPHGDSRPHAVRPDRAGKEQGRPAREGWWSEALQGGMCAASAASSITAPAQQHVDMDWTWDARPGDGSQNSVQVAGGRYRVRPVVDRVNHARPHRRTRGLRDSMVLEGKADLQLPPVLAFVLPIIFWERFDANGMRSETITVSTCTQRPHRTWSGARTGTRSGS